MSLLLLLRGGASGSATLTADAGTYTVTGQAAGLRVARRLVAESGAYTLAGVASGLRADRRITGATGTYSLTGVAADLLYSGGGGSPYTLTAAAGTYSMTGVSAGLRADRRITGGTGTYSLTGVAAGLARGLRVAAAAGAYTLTGQSAALRAARRMAADVGSYALTGVAAGLNYTGALNNLGQYLIELLGLSRWLLTDSTTPRYAAADRTVTRYLISEDAMTTVTTASAYLWLTEDQEAEFEFQQKNASTGALEAATGLTGMTVHVAATAGGSAIGALTFNLSERGTTGIYYAVMDTATLVAGLSTSSYPDGSAVYLVVSKSGDIASRSFRKIVKRQRVGDG